MTRNQFIQQYVLRRSLVQRRDELASSLGATLAAEADGLADAAERAVPGLFDLDPYDVVRRPGVSPLAAAPPCPPSDEEEGWVPGLDDFFPNPFDGGSS